MSESSTGSSMSPEAQRILREPFPPEQVGKLPRITCRNCSRSATKECDKHSKSRCTVCNNWITSAHVHLDYVGHAAVTDRFLKADPGWTWEPAYREVDPMVLADAAASGNPEVVAMVINNAPPRDEPGLWVRVTINGVTRLGYGTTDTPPGPDRDKQLVSDALKNAGMRFGVGLDLWSKEGLGSDESPAETPPPRAGRDWIGEANRTDDLDEVLQIGKECTAAGEFDGPVRTALLRRRRELSASAGSAAQHFSSN